MKLLRAIKREWNEDPWLTFSTGLVLILAVIVALVSWL